MRRLLLVPLAVVFCSPPDLGTDAAAKVCTDYANTYCARRQTCSAAIFAIAYPDFATCKLLQTNQCINNVIAPGSGDTTAAVQACTADIKLGDSVWSCADFMSSSNPSKNCVTATGMLPDGAPCAKNPQCQSGYCNTSGNQCGTCGPPIAVGSPCKTPAGIPTGCSGFGIYCNDVGVCVQYATLNGACSGEQACEPGYSCVAGICVAGQTQAGAACGGMSGQGCSDLGAGLDCNAQTQSCASMILVGPGSPCGYLFSQQFVHCAGGAMCVNGNCVAGVGLGQGCDLLAGPFCLPPSRCIPSSDGGTGGVCIITDATTCSN